MTNSRKFPLWLTVLFILGLAANVALYLTRDKRDSYYPATYKTLYVPSDVPALTGTRIVERGRVELIVPSKAGYDSWKVTDDTGDAYTTTGKYPEVKLKDHRHSYGVEPQKAGLPGPKMTFNFGYYPSEYYKKGGRTQPDNYWLVSASIPVGKFARHPLAFWASDYADIDTANREEAKRMIREDMGVADSDPTMTKIEKIGCWLVTRYKGCAGTPSDLIEKTKSPLRILKMVLAGEGKIWCSQHALIYHFFANMAGLPTRLLSLAGRIDTVITTGHAFAETFIPELGAWAKVDVSLNKLFMLNPEGKPLGSADVYNAINSGNIQALTVRVCRDGAAVSEPYAGANDTDSYYYSYGAHLVYRPGRARTQSQVVRYIFKPDLAYSLDASTLGRVYDLRRAVFAVWALIAILWVIAVVRFFVRRP
ncbi:MAG: hypothetical protein A2W03_13510 [Candidatus Aminicenantes bacterium RBG_16_63_16]|nr:MAG: hypothetical protein A2W03_13510 [Candidatus Aminicenantes bacterium RBG_16_63_16]